MPRIPFLGQTFTTRNPAVHCDTCINYYPESITKDDASLTIQKQAPSVSLYCTPGTLSRCNTGQPNVRGMLSYAGVIYAVSGVNFYGLVQQADGVTLTATLLGTLPTYPLFGPVSIISNGNLGNQLLIIDGLNKYVYNILNGAFGAVTDPSGVITPQATYQQGYGIMVDSGTNQFFITNLEDFSTINALNFASAYTKPDPLVAAATLKQFLILFGEAGTEIWSNTGTTTISGEITTFPYTNVTGSYLEQGCAAPFSITLSTNTLYWLTRNERGYGQIARIGGGGLIILSPEIVSTRPIEALIRTFAVIDDCIAYSYQDCGHEFIVFTFPTADATLVYDVTESLWHTRSTTRHDSPDTGPIYGRHVSNCYAFLNGVHYVGDWQSGNIYQMSTDFLTDNGAYIYRERTTQHSTEDNKRIFIKRFEVDMSKGNGASSGTGVNPQIFLYISRDGGHTFLNKGSKSFGALGQYLTRVYWTLLGMSRDWVIRVVVTDPIDHVLISAIGTVEVGDS